MPRTRSQSFGFAFITVVITVHLFVFYNLSFVEGRTLAELEEYGVPIFGHPSPIWAVVLVEFICALLLEVLICSPASLKLAFRVVNPAQDRPFIVQSAIISATACLMCPLMSLIATIIYTWGFISDFWAFMAQWLRTIMHNLPVAILSQLFFIQPLVRGIFGVIYRKQGA